MAKSKSKFFPIVALTAHGDQAAYRQRCFEAEMERVLSELLTPEKAFSMLYPGLPAQGLSFLQQRA